MARLIWKRTDAMDDQVVFELTEGAMVVGRDPKCGIFIDAPLLSREHARIEYQGGAHVVVDLDSTNLTKVNGERVFKKALSSGDQIHFSRVLCLYEA